MACGGVICTKSTLIQGVISSSAASWAALNSGPSKLPNESLHKAFPHPRRDWLTAVCAGGSGCEWDGHQTRLTREDVGEVIGSGWPGETAMGVQKKTLVLLQHKCWLQQLQPEHAVGPTVLICNVSFKVAQVDFSEPVESHSSQLSPCLHAFSSRPHDVRTLQEPAVASSLWLNITSEESVYTSGVFVSLFGEVVTEQMHSASCLIIFFRSANRVQPKPTAGENREEQCKRKSLSGLAPLFIDFSWNGQSSS